MKGTGCTMQGVCGKMPETAAMQDVLIYAAKGLGYWGWLAFRENIKDAAADDVIRRALFTTITNVNFDTAQVQKLVPEVCAVRDRLRDAFISASQKKHDKPFVAQVPPQAGYQPGCCTDGILAQAPAAAVNADSSPNEDIRSLREILLYGLKGMAAYADHAAVLGKQNAEVNAFFYEGLSALTDDSLSADDLFNLIVRFGHVNITCMALLDEANTGAYGSPVPTKVPIGHRKGKAILVSGHDLKDLYMLLEQTAGAGVDVYTHGEMLPAHAYPKLKAFPHFYGHYGTAWQNQYKEFDAFPGAILMTTNCIQRPANTYKARLFTTGLVHWPDVVHIETAANGQKNFAPVIEAALAAEGFKEDRPVKDILVGFGHDALSKAAGKVVELVKAGKIKHFYLIGGCDGAKPGRNYYTDFALSVPRDSVIVTLACGKFRFNTLDFGEIEGIPRLIDCGQCNDAYSAVVFAKSLAEAFNCTVNDLPLSFVLSWYEQKAVCVLLSLLALGVKKIKLGPSLPAFVSPNVLNILVEKFAIAPIATAEADLAETMKA